MFSITEFERKIDEKWNIKLILNVSFTPPPIKEITATRKKVMRS
jgi:hypothetical protein